MDAYASISKAYCWVALIDIAINKEHACVLETDSCSVINLQTQQGKLQIEVLSGLAFTCSEGEGGGVSSSVASLTLDSRLHRDCEVLGNLGILGLHCVVAEAGRCCVAPKGRAKNVHILWCNVQSVRSGSAAKLSTVELTLIWREHVCLPASSTLKPWTDGRRWLIPRGGDHRGAASGRTICPW